MLTEIAATTTLPDEVFLSTYFHDALGRMTTAVDNLGQTFRLDYDSLDAVRAMSDPNGLNPRSKGVIPVAILTTSTADGDSIDFDAWDVDPSTLAFGPNGAAITHAEGHPADVDLDGDLDMVVHFKTQETGIACGDTEATLTGQTFAGQAIEGTDSVKTAGCK